MRDRSNSSALRVRVVTTLDLIFGLRAWGLILYGVLPANLALLGVLEVKLGTVTNLGRFIFPIVLLPLLTTFLLVRNRHREWYLSVNLLNLRSLIVTFTILLIATTISGVAGIISGKYLVSWSYFNTKTHWMTIAESFLTAVGSLVLTSTLFLTILTKDSNFPGLPTVEFVTLLKKIRTGLRILQSSQVWKKFGGADEATIQNANTLSKDLEDLAALTGHVLPKLSLKAVDAGVKSFIAASTKIKAAGNDTSKTLSWNEYFGPSLLPATQNGRPPEAQTPDHAALISVLKALKLGK